MHYRHFDLQGLFGYGSIFLCALAACLGALVLSMIRYANETSCFNAGACSKEWLVPRSGT